MIAAIASAATIGLSCEILFYRAMRKKDAPALAYLIASIGLYTVLQNCISPFFGDDTKVIRATKVTVGKEIFGAYITDIQIITIVVSVVLFVAVNLCLQVTSIGKSIRAVSSNPELCNIYGINSNKIILIAFGIGSALAAVAGILSAMDTNMTPTFGFNLLLYGVVVMIIGGVGSTRGLVAGALLVATAQHLAAYYIDTKWMDAVTYLILILFLIWKPLGFSGVKLRKSRYKKHFGIHFTPTRFYRLLYPAGAKSKFVGWADGLVSLAHAGFYGIGAYTTAILSQQFHLPFWINLPVAMLICLFISLVVSLIALRTVDDYFIICTLGIQVIIFSLMNNWMGLTKGPFWHCGVFHRSRYWVLLLQVKYHFCF